MTERNRNLLSSRNTKFNLVSNQSIDSEQYEQALKKLYQINEKTSLMFEDRKESLQILADIMQNELQVNGISLQSVQKIYQAIITTVKSIDNSSKNEIEMNRIQRENEKFKIFASELQVEIKQTKQILQNSQKELIDIKNKYYQSQEEILKINIKLNTCKNKYEEQEKKLHSSEQRLEILSRKNIEKDKDQLKVTLNDVIKENEEYKRKIRQRDKEIDRLKDINFKQQEKVNNLHKKLEAYKVRKKLNDEEKNKISNEKYVFQENQFILDCDQFPKNLDFRSINIKINHLNFLKEIYDHGAETVVNQFDDDKREQVLAIANQFISYKDYGDKINSFLKDLFYIQSQHYSLHELMSNIQSIFKLNFSCDIIRLWIIDEMSGILYTIDENKKELRALTGVGMFGQALKLKKIIFNFNENQCGVYQSAENMDFTQKNSKFMIVPILNQKNQSVGIIEINNIYYDNFSTDEQYLGLILSKYISGFINTFYSIQSIASELKFQEIFFVMFNKLVKCENIVQFQQTMEQYSSIIFGTSKFQILYVEDNQFIKIKSLTQKEYYQCNLGLAGYVYQSKHSMIVKDILKNLQFHQNIDIESILPIYIFPIQNKDNEVMGIVEFIMRFKNKIVDTQQIYGTSIPSVFDQTSKQFLDSNSLRFSEFINSAYNIFKKIQFM